jgi:AcrR family transcriptional regulator
MSLQGAQSSTRERLLEAAITLFARQGYEATSITDIQRASSSYLRILVVQ